jgi:hypothetical protein
MIKMKTKITLITASAFLWLSSGLAQTPGPIPAPPCAGDLNGFVNYKNTINGTGAYQLQNGLEEKAAQTYNYSGPGRITSVLVYGSIPTSTAISGVPLKIGIYKVDLSGKPTTLIASRNYTWWSDTDSPNGYINVTFRSGVFVSNRFAVTVEIINESPYGNIFNLKYTGNGEGGGQDLASLAGTSTGNNWASAKNSFAKDGDFYIVPNMTHINNPSFTTTSHCYGINNPIAFSNTTQMTKDSMFNKIALPNHTGPNEFYVWNFGDGTTSNLMNPTHTYTAGGVYTVSLTSTIEGWATTCSKTFTSSISVGLAVTSASITNVLCHSSNNGSFTGVGQYGAPSYFYNINGGSWQSSPNFNSLFAGSYTLNILDANGCQNSTLVNITQPTGIIFNSILTTNASCGAATGAITALISGGVPILTLQLDGGSFLPTGSFSGLAAGTHTLVVKDANNCTNSSLVTINSLTGPTLNTPNVTNVSCSNGNDGSISLSSFGGTGLIQYSINGGTTFQTSGNFTSVAAGIYFCVVKDNAGCTNYTTVTISEGPLLNVTTSTMPVHCFGASTGQINVASSGGTGIRNYSINGISYQSGTNFSGLTAGTYTVYVKDVTSCIKSKTVTVTQPTALTSTLTSLATSCNGEEDGTIIVIADGGSGNYIYSLDGDEDFSEYGTFLNLAAGNHTITIQDLYNCNYTTTVSIVQPAKITTIVNTTNATCGTPNGSIQVIASGGSGSGYQYSIDGTNFLSSGVFSSLNSGTQFVLIKDGIGCSIKASGVIVSSGGPTITPSTSSSQNISCHEGNDGVITIGSVTGGTGVLEYSKDGVTFQTSNVLSGLSAGIYVVQVKDANYCIATETHILTEPNAFLIAPTTTSASCYGSASGSASIAASGGAGFLAYSIDGGISYQSGASFNDLYAGNYNIIVKDAANCTGTAKFTILQPTYPVSIYFGILNSSCYAASNGQIEIYAIGGTSPYLYSLDGNTFNSSNVFTNLAGNVTYTTYVKDANNCLTTTIQTISEPAILNVQSIVNNVSCTGGNNGIINLNVTGGVSPYNYQWSNGTTSSSNTNLNPGVYSVTVLDYNGCSSVKTYTLTQPALPLIANGVVTSATNNTSLDGAVDATTTGGTSPYSFSWSNGATTEDLTGLNPGAYLVTITDANGCTTSNTFNVGNLTGIEDIQISTSDVKVYPNPANEYITVEAIGYKIDKIELVNLLGQTIYLSSVNDSVIKINTTDILNGTYFVKINIGKNNTITKKINISK